MVSIFDKQIDSLFLNKAVEKITGWKTEDAKGKDLMKLAYPDPEYRKEAVEFMASLTPGFKDLIMRTKDGRDIDTTWTNVEIPDGRRIGIGIDITNRKEMEQELITAKEKAEKENLLRYAFIQNISHEIRTPMNSILGYAELLYNRVTEDDEIEFLDAISQSGDQLLRLIDDIIDFSRLDKDELTITKEEISVNEIIQMTQQLISGLEKTYNKKDVRFQFKVPSDENIIISTDVHRLNQVLTNLISNAIRYTDKGIIEVGYNVYENEKEITFFVKDTGIGIAKENHSLVFERFIRLHDDSQSIIRGTGLGLTICKHIVKLLGGEIGVESSPGEGSLFYFTHPFIEQKPLQVDRNDTEEESVVYPNLENYNLLIAEDDIFSFQMMKHMLSSTKANILHADTGPSTVEIVKNNNIDFLFLDIRLPELNGYQVIKQIRQFNESLPVVAQTANALPEDRQKIINAGFSAHISKPFSQEDLIYVINKFTYHSEKSPNIWKKYE